MATITVPTMTPRSGTTGGLDDVNDFLHVANSSSDNRLTPGQAKNYYLGGVLGGSNITAVPDTSAYTTTLNLDTTITGLSSVTSTAFVGDLTGNASTATALQTARNIAGQSFDGTANVDVSTSDLSDVSSTSPSTGQVLQWSGTEYVPTTASGSGTVTSVAVAGTDGIDVDSGSPITSTGTITLGLSSVPNSSLANSSVTVAGQTVALGASATVGITDLSDVYSSMSPSDGQALVYDTTNGWQAETLAGDIAGVTAGTNLNGGGTSGTVTVNLDTTITGLTSVTSSSFVGALTGNASTATALETARNIAGSSFDGTGDITIPITQLSDVYSSMSPTDGQALIYDTTNGWQSETLPSGGTVTSVALSGTDGIDVDSGSPITSSGTIQLGLSSVPNSSLANSSVDFGGVTVSLGAADATPAFDLADATNYPGDSNLVTTGTITSGTWQGTDIAADYIADTAVTPGSYTVASFTVDQQGRLTAASSGSISGFVSETSGTGSAELPSGTTAQRDGSPSAGYMRFNSTTSGFEGYNGSAWGAIGGGASGGNGEAAIFENDVTLDEDYTMTTDMNGVSAGPISIASGTTITVGSTSTWVIV